jgi:hypothetical protein
MDPNVEDISCNGYFMPVYVYLPGFESVPTGIRFKSEEELDDFVMYLVQKGGKSISAASPIQDVALPDGSRLNVTLYREVSSNGTTFSIRLANRAKGAAGCCGTAPSRPVAGVPVAGDGKQVQHVVHRRHSLRQDSCAELYRASS